MTPEAVIQAIEVALSTQLALLQIAYLSEEEFLAIKQPDASAVWVRSQIEMGAVKEIEVGRMGASIRSGVLKLFVHTGPSHVRQAAQIAGQCEALLRRKSLSGVEMGEPQTKRQENKRHQQETLLVQCAFLAY